MELRLFRRLIDRTDYVGEVCLDFSRVGAATKALEIETFEALLSHPAIPSKLLTLRSRGAENAVIKRLQAPNAPGYSTGIRERSGSSTAPSWLASTSRSTWPCSAARTDDGSSPRSPGNACCTDTVPRDRSDGCMAAFLGRPEAYLDLVIGAATSPWHQLERTTVDRAFVQLERDLASGEWDRCDGDETSTSVFASSPATSAPNTPAGRVERRTR
jgi:hypothetical protein